MNKIIKMCRSNRWCQKKTPVIGSPLSICNSTEVCSDQCEGTISIRNKFVPKQAVRVSTPSDTAEEFSSHLKEVWAQSLSDKLDEESNIFNREFKTQFYDRMNNDFTEPL